MAALNRFLIGLIAVLAIAAAVLSYLLFERRTEFRDRAGTLATTVVDMTRALDAESGTNVAKKVRFSAADKAAGVPESGELSWAEYHQDKPSGYQNFARNLKLTTDLAKSINEQRNFLAESIAQLGFDLEMPVDELNADDLKRADAPEVYARAAKQVSGQILTADIITAHNTFDNPEVVKPESFSGASLQGNRISLTMPPKSIVVLEVE